MANEGVQLGGFKSGIFKVLRQAGRWVGSKAGVLALLMLGVSARGATPTLHFWAVTGDADDATMYSRLAADFGKTHDFRVEVTPLAWGNFKMKYFSAMAAGLPPDIGITNLGGPFDYGSVGGLVDLRAEYPDRIKGLEDRFNTKTLAQFTIGKQLFGVPNDSSTLLIYYRTDIFKRLGLTPPKTWSQLNKTIGKLEAANYQFYFGFTATAQWAITLYSMAYGYQGIHLDPSGPAVDWLQPKYQKAVIEALDLWNMHNSPGRDLATRAIGLFGSDEPGIGVPMMLDLPLTAEQILNTRPDLDGKWAVAPWAHADDGQPFDVMGGTAYVIFRSSKMKKEAFEWLEYLNSLPVQREIAVDHMSRGLTADFFTSSVKAMWSPENDAFWAQPIFARTRNLIDVLKQTMPTLQTIPPLVGLADADRMEQDMLDSMGSFIKDKLQAEASSLGISQSELIRGFGQDKWENQKADIDEAVRKKLAQEYDAITPEAVTLLKRQRELYQTRYSYAINHFNQEEKATDVMKVAKWAACGLLLLGAACVLGLRGCRPYRVSYLFIAPPLILAVIFVFVPAAVAFYLSFTQYHPVLPLSTAKWVGLENYFEIKASGDLWSSLFRTFYYTVLTLPAGIVLALVFAYMLNNKLRGQRIWRFLYFSPLVTSVVSIALIFTQLFVPSKQGWLNAILLNLHLISDPEQFLLSERSFLYCVVVLAIWHGLAFTILVFLAGFQQVPGELFEAASVDGAGPVRRFWNVAVPGIRPQMFFITVLGFIGGFQVFETIYTLANKSGAADARFGPNDSGLTVVPLLYHYGFETFEMGKAAAVAYVLFLLILIITAIQLRMYRRREA